MRCQLSPRRGRNLGRLCEPAEKATVRKDVADSGAASAFPLEARHPGRTMFFSFLRSRGGSLSARMTSEEAEGTTETAA